MQRAIELETPLIIHGVALRLMKWDRRVSKAKMQKGKTRRKSLVTEVFGGLFT